jgi:hypothetical protein
LLPTTASKLSFVSTVTAVGGCFTRFAVPTRVLSHSTMVSAVRPPVYSSGGVAAFPFGKNLSVG